VGTDSRYCDRWLTSGRT